MLVLFVLYRLPDLSAMHWVVSESRVVFLSSTGKPSVNLCREFFSAARNYSLWSTLLCARSSLGWPNSFSVHRLGFVCWVLFSFFRWASWFLFPLAEHRSAPPIFRSRVSGSRLLREAFWRRLGLGQVKISIATGGLQRSAPASISFFLSLGLFVLCLSFVSDLVPAL
jgi:hypothetical protein